MIQIDDIKVYSLEECAQMLEASPRTIRRYIQQGKIKGQKVGTKIYVTEDTIKEFIKGGA